MNAIKKMLEEYNETGVLKGSLEDIKKAADYYHSVANSCCYLPEMGIIRGHCIREYHRLNEIYKARKESK